MAPRKPISHLVVEGKNDQHVIWALCAKHNIPETFSVEEPKDETGGVEALLDSISVRLKTPGMQILGFVIDADQDLQSRWQAVSDRLRSSGYTNLPVVPDPKGTILDQEQMPRIGVWLMPDNQLPGMLEDFVKLLVPDNDLLLPKAEYMLAEIEREGLHRYTLVHHSKALIHTWLAWQEVPGFPMGLSITAQILLHNNPIALNFVDWLNRLFQDQT